MTTNDMLAPFPVRPQNFRVGRTAFWFFAPHERVAPRPGVVAWALGLIQFERYVDGWGLLLNHGQCCVTHTKDHKD